MVLELTETFPESYANVACGFENVKVDISLIICIECEFHTQCKLYRGEFKSTGIIVQWIPIAIWANGNLR